MGKITDRRILKRKRRVSSNINGTSERPRISVFRSNKSIYAQAIDDKSRITVGAFSTLQIKEDKGSKKVDNAREVGMNLAKVLIEKKISECIFDRGRYSYNGRVKALAEGLREGGIKI